MRVFCPDCDARVRVPIGNNNRRVVCTECGGKFRPSEADEEVTPSSRDRSRQRTAENKEKAQETMRLGAVAGIGVGLLFIVFVGVALLMIFNQPKVVEAPPPTAPAPLVIIRPQPQTQPVVPDEVRSQPEVQTGVPAIPQNDRPSGTGSGTPAVATPSAAANPDPAVALDELFQVAADKPPPTAKMAVLKRPADAAPIDVPTFHSLLVANNLVRPSPLTKLTLDEVKRATVYVKVSAGDLSGSGSGFYIGSENGVGLVATNHHVIEAAMTRRLGQAEKPKILCVFNSGVPSDERSSPARVVAVDPVADLAILRLDNPPAKLPKPINPWATPKLTETMDVRICGFPFGEQLATATANPNISVNSGTVSSLRMNKNAGLDTVQIDGAINPGNSGGPIVDKDGRLVGVAVATIKGSGLGFAVPVNELIALLEGKVLFTEFLPLGTDGSVAKFRVVVPVMDPRSRVQALYVRYWAGSGAPPKAFKDPKVGYGLIPNGLEVTLKVPDGASALVVAQGDLKLPADATDVVIQLGSEQVAAPGQPRGLLAVSSAVEYKMTAKEVATGADAKPLGEVLRNPAALAGQTVVARGRVFLPPKGREAVEEIQIVDTADRKPVGLKFLTARELSVQFDEVSEDHQTNDVRLVCVVGKQGADGVVPVRIARCDFLDDAEVVVRTVPEADTTDKLAAANRNPAKFADQKITFQAASVLLPAGKPQKEDELVVTFPNLSRPRNLSFAIAPAMQRKVGEAKPKPNGVYKVRVTGTVGGKVPDGGVTPVAVSKIEILDPRDESVQKVIE